MNTKNNKRRQQTQSRIEKVFLELLETQPLNKISVTEICTRAQINRSTFYANYADVFDLADKLRDRLAVEFSELFADYDYFSERTGALRMFSHIKENQLFYTTYFKLCYDESHLICTYDQTRAEKEQINTNIKYHIEFFRNGLNAIIRLWLAGGCKESPEEMAEVLKQEYRGR